ncbi:hypothetical protein [Synechococcus sp. Cruz CV-v-12]|nr:hypothetical protein [Synechococcus sp. Cruz CV-v-12]MCP9874395.1 hypothetical protein [Synechococcus sp. Cruz CV-v-12]
MDATIAFGRDDKPVAHFADEWAIKNLRQRNAGLALQPLPFALGSTPITP